MARWATIGLVIVASLSGIPSHADGYCAPNPGVQKSVTIVGLQFLGGRWITTEPTQADTAKRVPDTVNNGISGVGGTSNKDATYVSIGDCILWTNDDAVDHSLTPTAGNPTAPSSWTEKGLAGATGGSAYSDRTYLLQIDSGFVKGTYKYHCTIHPGMVGEFTVL